MHPRSHRSLGPLASRIGVAALLVLALFTLSQCRRVSDRVSGVDVSLFRASVPKCIDKCQKAADQTTRMEDRFHASQVAACGGNPTCLENEEVRHQAALQAIENDRTACVNGCHSQGGGNN